MTGTAEENVKIRNTIIAIICAGTALTASIAVVELKVESWLHITFFIIPACLLMMLLVAILVRKILKRNNELKYKCQDLAQSEEALSNEINFIDQALDSLADIFFTLDPEGRIVRYNRMLLDKSGYTKEEVSGMHATNFFDGADVQRIVDAIKSVLDNGQTSLTADLVSRDGTKTSYELRGSLIKNPDGTPLGISGIGIDQTEKNSLTEQLIHSQKVESIGQLAGGLAHDLNNILSVVNGYATLLQHEIKQEEKAFRYTEQIVAASLRAADLTHGMLAYSRRQIMMQQNHNLNTVIEKVGGFITRILTENITFKFALSPEPLVVFVDSNQIEQVMINLTTNARDAMPGGGTFSISISAEYLNEEFVSRNGLQNIGRYAIITVSDTGCGMDEHTRQRIFDPFYTTKEVGKGTGLGLAMVNGIVAQHDGCVEVDSTPGNGTIFRLYLPLSNTDVVAATPAPAGTTALAMKKSGKILIVEDDQITRTVLDEMLTRTGYTVISASDGQDAVDKFANRKEDIMLVISDVVMPIKSGKTACDEIRDMCDATRFIFISGHADTVIEQEGELIDSSELVMKPIIPDQLMAKINAIMQET
jgi:PAS domain S-box-containing protein